MARRGKAGRGRARRGLARQGAARRGRDGRGAAGQGMVGRGPARCGRARQGLVRHGTARAVNFNPKRKKFMTHIEVEIEGRTPLLIHRFTDAQQLESTNGSRTATVGDRGSPREQAEASLYHGNDGKTLILPAMNVYSSIVGGGSFFKAGKSKVTTQKTSLLFACFEIEELELPINHKEPWTVDTRPVRMPSTGGRVLRHRPCFHDWRLSFTGKLDETVMTVNLLREIVDAAGARVGIGDYRPATKGPFGKFHVVSWQAEKLAPTSTKKSKR